MNEIGTGVNEEDYKKINSEIGIEFGLSSIGKLTSKFGGEVGHKVNWQRSEKLKATNNIDDAPKCGLSGVEIYNLVIDYNLKIVKERMFWTNSST